MRFKYTYCQSRTAVCIMQRAISDGLGVLSTRRVRVEELIRKFATDGKFSEVEHGCSPERTEALRSRGSNSESSVKRRPQVLT